MADIANMKKPTSPTIIPNLTFPFFRKIELKELPDIFVNKIITLTIIEALTNISIRNPLIVLVGMLTRKSKNSAKEAMKKEKRTCQ